MRPWPALTLAVCLAASGANAQVYHLVGKSDLGVVFVDAATIERSQDHATYWSTMFLFDDGNGAVGGLHSAFIMTRDEIDCAAGRARHLYLQSYDSRGLPTNNWKEPSAWDVVVPNSNQDVERRLVCDPAFLASDRPLALEPLQMLAATRKLRYEFK